jgi:2,3-bisphosphoglycerate-dependent phosphoglycerate mutase
MKLYFTRHGESEANLLREHSNRGFKHPLTAKGRKQAAGLAQKLAGVPVTRLFTSPLMRAVQTAEILSAALGATCEITDALREYDCGILEGRADEAAWAQHMAVFDAWVQRRDWERRIEGGESFNEIRDRFVPFVERLIAEYGESPANIVLVGHGGLYRCMLPLVLVNADFDFVLDQPMGNTACMVAEVGPEGLTLIRWEG